MIWPSVPKMYLSTWYVTSQESRFTEQFLNASDSKMGIKVINYSYIIN